MRVLFAETPPVLPNAQQWYTFTVVARGSQVLSGAIPVPVPAGGEDSVVEDRGITKRVVRTWSLCPYIEARSEVWKITGDESDPTGSAITACYTIPEGHYVGDLDFARYLLGQCIHPELSSPEHGVCSVGYSPVKRAWAGWSHRALCFFTLGDRVFEERYGDDKTPFKLHGRRVIANMEDARVAAVAFADYVS